MERIFRIHLIGYLTSTFSSSAQFPCSMLPIRFFFSFFINHFTALLCVFSLAKFHHFYFFPFSLFFVDVVHRRPFFYLLYFRQFFFSLVFFSLWNVFRDQDFKQTFYSLFLTLELAAPFFFFFCFIHQRVFGTKTHKNAHDNPKVTGLHREECSN